MNGPMSDVCCSMGWYVVAIIHQSIHQSIVVIVVVVFVVVLC